MQLIPEIWLALATLALISLLLLDLNGFRRGLSNGWKTDKNYKPKTLVIMPCRGTDLFLYENLVAAKKQRYNNYKFVAVVDKDDPAYPSVSRADVANIEPSTKCNKCSDKVRRIASAINKFRDYDVYVILDSDELVGSDWLEQLVAPLADKMVGASVMFPLFKPIKNGFWSNMKQVWGFVGQSLMESRRTRFVAGGSIAFRKNLLDKDSYNFFTNSRYSLSDDICLNLIVGKKGLQVAYTSGQHPVTYIDDDIGSLSEWANRQAALSIFANRKILHYGVVYYSAEILVFVTGVFGAFFVSPYLILFLLHFAMSLAKNERWMKNYRIGTVLITAMMPFFYLSNLIIASRMRSIRWRGIDYRLR